MSFKASSSVVIARISKPPKPPKPIVWGSPPGYGLFSQKELDLIEILSQAQEVEGGPWSCILCRATYKKSGGLLIHLVLDQKCRRYEEFKELGLAQTLIVQAAVDWGTVCETIESYVGLWERGELELPDDLEDVEYYKTDEEDTGSDLLDAESISPPPRNPQTPLPITRKRKRNDSLDTWRALDPLPATRLGNEIIRFNQAPLSGNSQAPPPDHHANFYDAVYDRYIYHAPTSPAISIDLLIQNKRFPLQPPSKLHRADQEDYKRRLKRLQIYTSHRGNYLKAGTLVVGRKEQLLADWNANDTLDVVNSKKTIYKTYDSWDTRRLHDTKKLKVMLRASASSSSASASHRSSTSASLAPTTISSAPAPILPASATTLQASMTATPASVSTSLGSKTTIAEVTTSPASVTTVPASATTSPAPTTTLPASASEYPFSAFKSGLPAPAHRPNSRALAFSFAPPAPTTTRPSPTYVPTFGAPSVPSTSASLATPPTLPPRALPFAYSAPTTTFSPGVLPFASRAPTYNPSQPTLPAHTPVPGQGQGTRRITSAALARVAPFARPMPEYPAMAPVPRQGRVTGHIPSTAPAFPHTLPRPTPGIIQRNPVPQRGQVAGAITSTAPAFPRATPGLPQRGPFMIQDPATGRAGFQYQTGHAGMMHQDGVAMRIEPGYGIITHYGQELRRRQALKERPVEVIEID